MLCILNLYSAAFCPEACNRSLRISCWASSLRQICLASQVAPEQKELVDLLEAPAADEARIDELIDILAASEQPFLEASIGGGPWQVYQVDLASSLGHRTSKPQMVRAETHLAGQASLKMFRPG